MEGHLIDAGMQGDLDLAICKVFAWLSPPAVLVMQYQSWLPLCHEGRRSIDWLSYERPLPGGNDAAVLYSTSLSYGPDAERQVNRTAGEGCMRSLR